MVRSNLTSLVIAGPTGCGKSALALRIAKKFNGEIVCADSRQFYQHMQIGTAGPSAKDLAQVPHHGYASVDPATTKIDVGFFINFAQQKIREIKSRNKRPILVGGTGFYLRALRYGMSDVPKSDKKIIQEIEKECDELGLDKLYSELSQKDPQTAAKVSPNDKFRIIRAIEIIRTTKQSASALRISFKERPPQIFAHWVYKKPKREELLRVLKARVDAMFNVGLVDEAKHLRDNLPKEHWALDVMGYREALLFVDGALSLAQAKEKTFIRHRQYAKRQYTWFNAEGFYFLKIS